ncbi:NUDIX domain-containing protein [Frateuria aurantia]
MRERFKASIAVFAVVRRDDRVLMILRSHTGWLDGYWSLPAGGMDGGETAAAAASRELAEEACLTVPPTDLQLIHTQHNFTHADEWLGLYFEATEIGGRPAIGEPDKHGELAWFRLDELPANTVPYVRLALECAARQSRFSVYSAS